jgi:hypothetical protein
VERGLDLYLSQGPLITHQGGDTFIVPSCYRLQATADAANWFVESNNTNNFTWANVQLKHSQVSVLRYGPSAQPISG